jgi:hypothetical protein
MIQFNYVIYDQQTDEYSRRRTEAMTYEGYAAKLLQWNKQHKGGQLYLTLDYNKAMDWNYSPDGYRDIPLAELVLLKCQAQMQKAQRINIQVRLPKGFDNSVPVV